MEYWEECISEALEDAGVSATKEQIATVARWAEGAHENYSMAFGYDCIPNPVNEENERLKKELRRERSKMTCPRCKGIGREVIRGPIHNSDSECFRCRGEGRID